jgi:hypothetical protein
MCHGLPTTVEEYTVWTLNDCSLDTFDPTENKDIWQWIINYGHLFLDHFEFVNETDMGHGAQTQIVLFAGQVILVLGGGMFVSTDMYLRDLPDCFRQVHSRSMLI